jgi:hypothetical protein
VVSVGREASLKDSIRELWPKMRALATKALDAYKENPELRQKVADQIQQGAEFGTRHDTTNDTTRMRGVN